jgi:hypothetical protein
MTYIKKIIMRLFGHGPAPRFTFRHVDKAGFVSVKILSPIKIGFGDVGKRDFFCEQQVHMVCKEETLLQITTNKNYPLTTVKTFYQTFNVNIQIPIYVLHTNMS